jgi:hypothetical protein
MADETCNWQGASGRSYTFYVHALPVSFSVNQAGNYIYAVRNAQRLWVPIYIGEGELADRISDAHHKADCIRRKGSTHVHVHINSVEKARKDEETDLLAHYTNAYEPSGCNEKSGG